MEACCVSLYYKKELLRQEFLKRPTFTQVRNITAGYREYVNKKLPAIETWDEEVEKNKEHFRKQIKQS